MADKYWIKQGDEVAHRDNLSQKMFVESIVRQSAKEAAAGDVTDKEGNKWWIRHVICHFWEELPEGRRRYVRANFHTKELVPWEIHDDFIAVQKFLSNGRSY